MHLEMLVGPTPAKGAFQDWTLAQLCCCQTLDRSGGPTLNHLCLPLNQSDQEILDLGRFGGQRGTLPCALGLFWTREHSHMKAKDSTGYQHPEKQVAVQQKSLWCAS
ncbi:hypothetical protein PoB_000754100 [Plakobranchus ocellatus]|uniref:Uncharacterized protein n=1 Tax=Plakobranchus ocellatus TaxID=259542 RepID=A0AAV3Y1C5_9GAST|nr:hypothetical protein PoB_000754100 [Plakobranchus ocellatus]